MTVQRSEVLDIPILDDGLLDMLLPQNVIQSMLKYTNLSHSGTKENKICKAAVIYLLKIITIYITSFNTPAMRALSVNSTFNRTRKERWDQEMNDARYRRRLRCYVLLSIIFPFLHELAEWKVSELESESWRENENDNDQMRRHQQRLAHKRQMGMLRLLLKVTSFIIPPIQLYNFVSFIFRQKSTPTPLLSMNLSGIEFTAMNPIGDEERKRSINFLYAYRRVWYEELILTLGILPLDIWRNLPHEMNVSYRRIITKLRSFLSRSKIFVVGKKSGEGKRNHFNSGSYAGQSCEACRTTPITVPYKTSCGHWYCYACLRTAITDNLDYHCIVCGEKIVSSRPFR